MATADSIAWALLRDVAVDDLGQTDVAALGSEIESLRLDTGRVHRLPLHVLLLELAELSILLVDGLDGLRTVDWLGSAGDIRESDDGVVSLCCFVRVMVVVPQPDNALTVALPS